MENQTPEPEGAAIGIYRHPSKEKKKRGRKKEKL